MPDRLADAKCLGHSCSPSNSVLGSPVPQGHGVQAQMADWALGGLGGPIPLGSSQGVSLDPEEVGVSTLGAPLSRAQGWLEKGGTRVAAPTPVVRGANLFCGADS